MRFIIYTIILLVGGTYFFVSFQNLSHFEQENLQKIAELPQPLLGTFDDYFSDNANLKTVAHRKVLELSDRELAGIVLMPAYEKYHKHNDLMKWIRDYNVGGFMILTPNYDFVDMNFVNTIYKKELPLLVSIDAEPSLVKYRLPSLKNIPNTDSLDSVLDSTQVANTISRYISNIGANINFAPVYDGNQNQSVIGNRSYGNNAEKIHELARAFSDQSMQQGIVPTAKHFPGHGNVSGDTHKNLQTIDGELVELEQFKLAIADNIPIIMVGHLAVQNNNKWETDGLPASLSKEIMTDLLKNELGYRGLIITDALNMGALDAFGNTSIKALEAGADIVLLPKDVDTAFVDIYKKIQTDSEFKKIIQQKAQKIIKLKLVLRNIKK